MIASATLHSEEFVVEDQSGTVSNLTISPSGLSDGDTVLQMGVDFSFDAMPNWIFNAGYFGSFGEDGYSSHGGMIGVKIDF